MAPFLKMGYSKIPTEIPGVAGARAGLIKDVRQIDGITISIAIQDRNTPSHALASSDTELTVYVQNMDYGSVINCFIVPANRPDLVGKLERQCLGEFLGYDDFYSWIWHLPRRLMGLYHARYESKCRIKNCSGKVKPCAEPGLGGLCADHQERQRERERHTGEFERTIRRTLRPQNQKTFDLWNIGPTRPEWSAEALELVDSLLESHGPRFDTLKKARKSLDPEEREQAIKAGATWNRTPDGKVCCGIWKATVNGKTWYVCHTHRCYQAKPTLKGAIHAFKFVKSTA